MCTVMCSGDLMYHLKNHLPLITVIYTTYLFNQDTNKYIQFEGNMY